MKNILVYLIYPFRRVEILEEEKSKYSRILYVRGKIYTEALVILHPATIFLILLSPIIALWLMIYSIIDLVKNSKIVLF